MKKTVVIVSLALLVVLVLVLFNYTSAGSWINNFLETGVARWGYVGIFISVFVLEFVPQPVISSLLPVSAGLFLKLSFGYVLLVSVSAAVLSNYFAYFFGKAYGEPIARFFVSEKNYDKTKRWFEKYGIKAFFFLALLPLPYFPIMMGILNVKLRELTIYAIIPRILHFTIFTYLISLVV